MKNIVVITPIYKFLDRGDLKTDTQCVHDLLKYNSNNYNIKVVVPYRHQLKKIFSNSSINYLKYRKKGYDYNCEGIPVSLIEWQNIYPKQSAPLKINQNKFVKKIKNKVEESIDDPDLLIYHIPSFSMFIGEKLNYKCNSIAILHYSDVIYLKNNEKSFINYLENNFSEVYCRSKAIYEVFSKYNLKNLSDRIIYSGVNVSTNIKVESKKNNENKILYVGKLIPRKNLELLIKTLGTITNYKWSLSIIGEGQIKNRCEKLVKKLKLENNISFLGYMNKEGVYKNMQLSNIFCMPSIKETLGLVYLEAMTNGNITIGTKNEGIDGIIIDDENGFLIEPTMETLRKTLIKIFDMTESERKRIIENAMLTTEKFTEEKMSYNYFEIIKKNL